MKSLLTVGYADLDCSNEDLFVQILSKYFRIEFTQDNPDILLCSIFGNSRYSIRAKKKLLWIGENVRPHLNDFEYVIGYDYIQDSRYLRFPLWKYYLHLDNRRHYIDELVNKDTTIKNRPNFMSFTVSSPNGLVRNNFFHYTNNYKQVDSFGKLFNNKPDIVRHREDSYTWQKRKIEYFRNNPYKFAMCFENSKHSGYTTEKLIDAMLCNTIPIYYGDPSVNNDFNVDSFINCDFKDQNDLSGFNDILSFIKRLDTDDDLYESVYSRQWLTDEQKTRIYINDLEEFILNIVNDKI